jgi:hypothetical protein
LFGCRRGATRHDPAARDGAAAPVASIIAGKLVVDHKTPRTIDKAVCCARMIVKKAGRGNAPWSRGSQRRRGRSSRGKLVIDVEACHNSRWPWRRSSQG